MIEVRARGVLSHMQKLGIQLIYNGRDVGLDAGARRGQGAHDTYMASERGGIQLQSRRHYIARRSNDKVLVSLNKIVTATEEQRSIQPPWICYLSTYIS